MGIYGNLLTESSDIYSLEENSIIMEVTDEEFEELKKNWTTSNENHKRKEFINNNVSEEDYQRLAEVYKVLRTAEKYKDYKKAFEELCSFCHIVPHGTIITACKIRSGNKENKNSVYVQYSENTKKIKVPQGVKLYHMSKVEGITQLNPFFRGKSAKGFMYYAPRIYFTLRKNMPKALADYRMNEKMIKYECTLNISEVYVDPLIPDKHMLAVYVETDKPIPVKRIN